MIPLFRSPYAINSTSSATPSPIPPALRSQPAPAARSQSYDSALLQQRAQDEQDGSEDSTAPPPLPGR